MFDYEWIVFFDFEPKDSFYKWKVSTIEQI